MLAAVCGSLAFPGLFAERRRKGAWGVASVLAEAC